MVNYNLILNAGSQADYGGAINVLNDESEIHSCNFLSNKAVFAGGAIYNLQTMYTVDSSNFTSNTAIQGGAIYQHGGILRNLVFTRNEALGVS